MKKKKHLLYEIYKCCFDTESIFTKFHKWETSVTMDKQLCWCHRREMKFSEMMTIEELLIKVVSTVSSGGLSIAITALSHRTYDLLLIPSNNYS